MPKHTNWTNLVGILYTVADGSTMEHGVLPNLLHCCRSMRAIKMLQSYARCRLRGHFPLLSRDSKKEVHNPVSTCQLANWG